MQILDGRENFEERDKSTAGNVAKRDSFAQITRANLNSHVGSNPQAAWKHDHIHAMHGSVGGTSTTDGEFTNVEDNTNVEDSTAKRHAPEVGQSDDALSPVPYPNPTPLSSVHGPVHFTFNQDSLMTEVVDIHSPFMPMDDSLGQAPEQARQSAAPVGEAKQSSPFRPSVKHSGRHGTCGSLLSMPDSDVSSDYYDDDSGDELSASLTVSDSSAPEMTPRPRISIDIPEASFDAWETEGKSKHEGSQPDANASRSSPSIHSPWSAVLDPWGSALTASPTAVSSFEKEPLAMQDAHSNTPCFREKHESKRRLWRLYHGCPTRDRPTHDQVSEASGGHRSYQSRAVLINACTLPRNDRTISHRYLSSDASQAQKDDTQQECSNNCPMILSTQPARTATMQCMIENLSNSSTWSCAEVAPMQNIAGKAQVAQIQSFEGRRGWTSKTSNRPKHQWKRPQSQGEKLPPRWIDQVSSSNKSGPKPLEIEASGMSRLQHQSVPMRCTSSCDGNDSHTAKQCVKSSLQDGTYARGVPKVTQGVEFCRQRTHCGAMSPADDGRTRLVSWQLYTGSTRPRSLKLKTPDGECSWLPAISCSGASVVRCF